MSARRGGRVCGGGTRRGRPAVRMRRCCGPADVCGRVCVRVLILSLNTVKHVLPSFTVLVPADDVTAWTLTNLSGAAQARIFSGLSISTPRKCLNSFSFANRAFSSHLSPRECTLPTGCHWYGGSWESSRPLGSGRGGMCADGNRWRFILEACWATSTLHVPFCRPIAERASVARPSLGGTDGAFWRRATAQCSLLAGLHRSSQEQTWSPSVGNIQELQSLRPNGLRKCQLKLCMAVMSATLTLLLIF